MPGRVSFGKLEEVLSIPDLVGVQIDSYNEFLQKDVPPEKRKNQGLQEVFNEVFPIESFDKQLIIEFVSYTVGDPKESAIDSIRSGNSYSSPLHVDFLLKNKDESIPETVYLGEIPMMTDRGTFVVNGAERVIISQLHRSPGICFEKSIIKWDSMVERR